MNPQPDMNLYTCVGVVTAAQGIRGEVRVKSFMDNPTDLVTLASCLMGKTLKATDILKGRLQKHDVCILQLEGTTDRNQAEALKGVKLYMAKKDLPELDSETFYHHDLVDLKVQCDDGKDLGHVSGVFNFGAGDLLEVTLPDQTTLLIPFEPTRVLKVDLDNRLIVIEEGYVQEYLQEVPRAEG